MENSVSDWKTNFHKREGTGRVTTQRQRLNATENRGARTGIQLNMNQVDKIDGYALPGSFFEQIKLAPSTQPGFNNYDSFETTPRKEPPVVDIQNITPIRPENVSFEASRMDISPQVDYGGHSPEIRGRSPEPEVVPSFRVPKKRAPQVKSSPMDISMGKSMHIGMGDVTPKNYRDHSMLNDTEEEFYKKHEETDPTFVKDDDSELPEDEEEDGEEVDVKSRLRRGGIKPVSFWQNERPEYRNEELIGKVILPLPKSKVRKTETAPLTFDADFGKYPVKTDKGVETMKIFATRESTIEQHFRLIQDVENEDEPVDVKLRVALTNQYLKTGLVEIDPHSTKPVQNSDDYYEVFYCVSGQARVTIHESVFVIKSGGHFMVPPHNTFSISNEWGKVCKFCYFMTHV